MIRFYVAKVVKPDGRRSNAITLYAASEEEAREKVAQSGFGYGHETIHVADIEPDTIGRFDRYVDDGRGICEHADSPFSDNGPIDPYNIFPNK